jgi:dienelactone hydrolase
MPIRKARVPVLLAALLLAGCVRDRPVTSLADGGEGWVAFPAPGEPITLRAEVRVPAGPGPFPAMLQLHGSAGMVPSEKRWADFFIANGIAVMRLDYFGPRGMAFNTPNKPVPMHDVFAALRLLASHPRVDAARIGVIGFSRGGAMAINASSGDGPFRSGVRTVAHIGVYPACDIQMPHIPADPEAPALLFLLGDADEAAPARFCTSRAYVAALQGRDVRTIVYPGAHHGWDAVSSAGVPLDMLVHDVDSGTFGSNSRNPLRAEGRTWRVRYDHATTVRSLDDTLAFLREHMRLPPGR